MNEKLLNAFIEARCETIEDYAAIVAKFLNEGRITDKIVGGAKKIGRGVKRSYNFVNRGPGAFAGTA